MSRPIILGRDFTIPNAITIGWTRQGTKKLCMDNDLVMETEENFEGKTLSLSRPVCIPPHTTAVVEVACITNMEGKFQVQPSPVFLRDNPNIYCKPLVYDMSLEKQTRQTNSPDLPDMEIEINNIEPMNTPASLSKRQRKKKKQDESHHSRIPFFITNLSSMSRVILPKDHIMAFITPEKPEMNYIEISEVESVEDQCKNWKCPTKQLPKAPSSDFLVSPGDVKEVRKCVLPESIISNETHQ